MPQKTLGIDASRANVRDRTGTERYAYELIRELMRLIPKNVRVLLYSREPLLPDLAALPEHWESRVLGWPPKRLWTQARLSWEMLRRPPDMLFVPVHVLPLFLPRRTVVTLHDVAFATEPDAYGWFENWYQRFAIVWALARADRVLAVSEFSKSELVGKFGGDPKKITVTPLACDAERYRRPADDAIAAVLARHGIRSQFFLFVGRLERKKNLDGLLAAFSLVKKSRPDVSLVLAGKPGYGYADIMHRDAGREGERTGTVPDKHGRGQSPLEKLRNKEKPVVLQGVPGSADWGQSPLHGTYELGFVPQDDLPALYAGAAAFVFPSRYEGFGLPVLEAFAAGTPVVASKTTSLPEVAGDAALFVDPERPQEIADAMLRIMGDAQLADDLRKKGEQRLAQFSWKRTAELTWAAIRSLL